jgi:hypothetical protein
MTDNKRKSGKLVPDNTQLDKSGKGKGRVITDYIEDGCNNICVLCGTQFVVYHELYKHIKENECAIKDWDSKNTVRNIQQNVKNSHTINTNNITVDGNVRVVRFGDENLSYISDDLYKHILGKGLKAICEFIEHSHFNPKHPENHNIYITNIKSDHLVLYNGDKWTIAQRDEQLEDIIYAKSEFLYRKFKELSSTMDLRDIQQFQNFINCRDEEDIMNILKNELVVKLYENRMIPQMRRKAYVDNLLTKDSIRDKTDVIIKDTDYNRYCVINEIKDMLDTLTYDNLILIKEMILTLN